MAVLPIALTGLSTKPSMSIAVAPTLAPADHKSPSWMDLRVCAAPSATPAPAKLWSQFSPPPMPTKLSVTATPCS
jgi:hypothetical protein